MAASSYDLASLETLSSKKRRRFTLPRLRAAGIGGGYGLLVVALGLVVIGIGWNGMAGGGGQVNGISDLRAQLPWLVSGGILGLALVVFGATMIVVHNARTDRARLEAKLDELVVALGRGGAPYAGAIPYPAEPSRAEQSGTAPSRTAPAGTFVTGPSAYHDPSCRLVQGRDDISYATAAEVDARGLRACRVCKPAALTAKR